MAVLQVEPVKGLLQGNLEILVQSFMPVAAVEVLVEVVTINTLMLFLAAQAAALLAAVTERLVNRHQIILAAVAAAVRQQAEKAMDFPLLIRWQAVLAVPASLLSAMHGGDVNGKIHGTD